MKNHLFNPVGNPQPALRYNYLLDQADNLIYIMEPEGARSYTHDPGNKIDQSPYQHDPVGNRIADATRTYEWDADNRLVGIGYIGLPGKKTRFRYDGQSRRVAAIETDGGQTTETRYIWCGGRICQARDGQGQTIAHYYSEGVWRPLEKKREYYAKDHLGSIRDVLDETGQAIARYDYTPYGQLIEKPLGVPAPQGTSTLQNPNNPQNPPALQPPPEFGYAGMQYHAPSGLYLTKYRAYDPQDGRWLSRDPIEEAGGLNLYAYVEGDPVNYIDPEGLEIKLSEYNTPAQDADYREAIDYLKNSKTAASLIRHLETDTTVYYIVIMTGRTKFVEFEGKKTIYWDSREMTECLNRDLSSSGYFMSAALGLIHEMDHAAYFDHKKSETPDPDKYFDNLEEKRVILGVENSVARELNEAKGANETIRNTHLGRGVPASSPTSTNPFDKKKP